MRKPYHLRFVHVFVLFTFSLFCIFFSCKKLEKELLPLTESDASFFKQTTDANPVVKRIAAALQVQNREEKFVEQLSKREGLPVWNKAIITTIATDTVVAIPLVLKNTRYVNSYMLYKLRKQGSIAFLVKGRQPYFFSALTNQSLDAAKISRQLMALNNHVFGDTLFTIIDGKILNRSSGKQLITFKPPSTNLTVGTRVGPPAGVNNQTANRVVTFCYWEDSGDDEGNDDGGGGETGGGGGGQPFLPAVRVPVWVCDLWITVDPPLPPGTPTIPQTPIGGGGGVSGGNNPVTPVPPLNNYSCPSYYTQQQCAEMTMPPVIPINQPQIQNPLSATVKSLSLSLALTSNQSAWLNNHQSLANQIANYLSANNSVENYSVAKSHIEMLIADPDYLSFNENHTYSGNASSVWWKDYIWLSNPGNFNLSVSGANNEYDKLTVAEKALIVAYPRQAYQISKNVDKSYQMAVSRTGKNGLNDKSDAFRHAFFNAINTRDVSPDYTVGLSPAEIVRQFAIAHESEVPSPLMLEKTMDLFNNDVGINYCNTCSSGLSDNSIANVIMQKLTNGELKYLDPLDPIASALYDLDQDGIQDCPTCRNGIIATTVLKYTNQ